MNVGWPTVILHAPHPLISLTISTGNVLTLESSKKRVTTGTEKNCFISGSYNRMNMTFKCKIYKHNYFVNG